MTTFADHPNRPTHQAANGNVVRWTVGRWNMVFPTVVRPMGTVQRFFSFDAAVTAADQDQF